MWDDTNMWLAPFNNTMKYSNQKEKLVANTVVVSFEKPVAISCIQLWNYSKDPLRGVNEFLIELDNILLYEGSVRQAPSA